MADASPSADITAILNRWSSAAPEERNQTFEAMYATFKQCAMRIVGNPDRPALIQPTALVNEAYLKLCQGEIGRLEGRTHFMALAARVMRQIVIDTARADQARKRDWRLLTRLTSEPAAETGVGPTHLLDLDDALTALEAIDADYVRIVEARLFAGYTVEETAQALDMSPATVKRKWSVAQIWLNERLGAP
ncbi:MAG: ECF-type sigma factor [Pseudomonadales bacterium]